MQRLVLTIIAMIMIGGIGAAWVIDEYAPTNGFAVTLKLDKDTYNLGEDIPAHIGCSRQMGDWVVHGNIFSPLCNADLEVKYVEAEGRPPNDKFCMKGGGSSVWAVRHVEKGAVVPEETSLNAQCLLPSYPGTFKVRAIWSAYSNEPGQEIGAKVHSQTITFHVVEK